MLITVKDVKNEIYDTETTFDNCYCFFDCVLCLVDVDNICEFWLMFYILIFIMIGIAMWQLYNSFK